jgi:hypothetical protein
MRATADGGVMRGGAPRAVWLTLGAAAGAVSAQSAAATLIDEGRPCHLVWDPATGEIAQLLSVLRAGCALGTAGRGAPAGGTPPPGAAPSAQRHVRGAATTNVNTEGRVCVQIGVLGHHGDPFAGAPQGGAAAIVSWLDSWGVRPQWPAGRPACQRRHGPARDQLRAADCGAIEHGAADCGAPSEYGAAGERAASRQRALWALGGHFGGCQVPGLGSCRPARLDTGQPPGTDITQVQQREAGYLLFPAMIPIPA